MRSRTRIAAAAALLVVAVVALTGCLGQDGSDGQDDLQTDPPAAPDDAAPPANETAQLRLVVNTTGPWAGSYFFSTELGEGEQELVHISGDGPRTFVLDPPSSAAWTFTASVTRQSSSDGLLELTVENAEGTVLAQSNTTEPFGLAAVQASG